MDPEIFKRLVADFSTEFGPWSDDRPQRLGNWVADLLGIGPVCVALGYRDGYFARRLFRKVDARSTPETVEWSKRYRRAWLTLNRQQVDSRKASDYLTFAESEQGDDESEEALWLSLMQTYEWDNVGHWGPGAPVVDVRIERLQLLFVTARTVELARGPHAAFSYLIGTDPLSGTAPVLSIRLRSREGAEDTLRRAYVHAVETESLNGLDSTEPRQG